MMYVVSVVVSVVGCYGRFLLFVVIVRYVSAMCSVHTEMQLVHQQEIAVLFSEATHRSVDAPHVCRHCYSLPEMSK